MSEQGSEAGAARWLAACAVLVQLCFFAACLVGIADIWSWGHDGFNGAAFAQGARNTLRFGNLAPAQYWTDLSPPPPEALYTHHPLLLPLHLVAAIALFGMSEWAVRLTPALYMVGTIVLLHRVARNLYGEATALLAVVVYALIPLHLVFANMVSHEPGSIFWCLAFLTFYLRWLDDRRRRDAVFGLVALSLALHFDWPGYFLAFFVACHAACVGVAAARRGGGVSPELRFTAVLSVVVLANAALYFAWIHALKGDLGDMQGAFVHRFRRVPGYGSLLLERSWTLYGPLPLALAAAWLAAVGGRALRGRFLRTDLIPLCFLGAQLVHSGLFQNAGVLHAYFTQHAGVAIALGGASTAVSLATRVRGRARALAAALLAVGLVAQVAHDVRWVPWGLATGRATYVADFDDQYAAHRWAVELGRRHPRPGVRYVIHRSAPQRIHFLFYLDSPYRLSDELAFRPDELRRGGPNTLLLADLRGLDPHERKHLERLARVHSLSVWQDRFVVVDARGPGGRTERWQAVPDARWWWPWLGNFRHERVRWVGPDASLQTVQPTEGRP